MKEQTGMGSDHSGAEELLQLYQQLQGQAPADAPPALQELFDDISKSQRDALKEKLDDRETQVIYPTPGFVVKTADENGQKVFINICSNDKISPPSSWENGVMPDSAREALQNLDEVKSEEDVQAMRVPLSLSEHRSELDKNGGACLVFDCVFAEQVMNEAAKFRPMKIFIIECCLGWIHHKCKVKLDPKFKLPKLKYKGDTIHEHRIRKEKQKLVTEIEEVMDDDDTPSLPLLAKKPARSAARLAREQGTAAGHDRFDNSQSSPRTTAAVTQPLGAPGADDPCHLPSGVDLLDVQYEGTPCDKVVISFKLDPGVSGDDLESLVQADLNCIHVCPKKGAPLAVPLNVYVNPATCQCKLQGDVLAVEVDYMTVNEIIQLSKDRKPLDFGEIDLQSQEMLHELD
eukprot:jgi/Ulvmu1/7798/UM004_0027.1